MSSLDQAFMKAYAKENSGEQPTTSPRSAAPLASPPPRAAKASAPAKVSSQVIENLYAEGALYRIEMPTDDSGDGVGAPHFQPAPIIQRRRSGRRFLSRSEAGEIETPPPAPARSRPISRLARGGNTYVPPRPAHANDLKTDTPRIAPAPPLAPPPALDEYLQIASAVAVQGHWDASAEDHQASAESQSQVVLSDSSQGSAHPGALLHLDLDALPEPAVIAPIAPIAPAALVAQPPAVAPPELAAPIVAPAQVPAELPAPPAAEKIHRLDAPAASAVNIPHFPLAASTAAAVESIVESAPKPAEITDEERAVLSGVLTPAAIAAITPPPASPAPIAVEAVATKPPFVPQWEVDRVLWPEVCQRLLKDEHSYFSQAGKKLTAAVRDGLKTLAVTGAKRGEGRTTLTLCLARCAAQAGLSVAVMDADFARPQVAVTLGLDVPCGWQAVAAGKMPLAEAAVKSVADNLTVLPLETKPGAAPLSLADRRVAATIRAVAAEFDLVIVDCGPVPAGAGPLFPVGESAPFDAAIVLRDMRAASAEDCLAVGARLHQAGIEAVGIAENFVPAENAP